MRVPEARRPAQSPGVRTFVVRALDEAPPGRPRLPTSNNGGRRGRAMDIVVERCCGLDVHKDTVVACVRTPGKGGKRAQETRRSGP